MYEFIVQIMEPFTLFYLLLMLTVINLWRKRKETRRRLWLLTLAFLGLTLSSLPIVAYLVTGSLEWQYPPPATYPDDVQAIVLLSAGLRAPDEVRPQAELTEDSLQRCLHTADLYHKRVARLIIVSGGKVDPEQPGPTISHAMAEFLVQIGVKKEDIVLEETSSTTYENAVETVKLLKQKQITKAVLVTDAVDMLRADCCFRKQGMELIPSPCHYRTGEFEMSLENIVPSSGSAHANSRSCHEWLGMFYYWLRGRI
jgi:uncharacterized SAM-binding protein YcdF (DUF218 family)